MTRVSPGDSVIVSLRRNAFFPEARLKLFTISAETVSAL